MSTTVTMVAQQRSNMAVMTVDEHSGHGDYTDMFTTLTRPLLCYRMLGLGFDSCVAAAMADGGAWHAGAVANIALRYGRDKDKGSGGTRDSPQLHSSTRARLGRGGGELSAVVACTAARTSGEPMFSCVWSSTIKMGEPLSNTVTQGNDRNK